MSTTKPLARIPLSLVFLLALAAFLPLPARAQECGAGWTEPVVCEVELALYRPDDRRGERFDGGTLRLATRSEIDLEAVAVDQDGRRFPDDRLVYSVVPSRYCEDLLSVEALEDGGVRLETGSATGDCELLFQVANNLNLDRRIRVLFEGAEYRGRGRETMWQGTLTLTGNRFARFAQVNFLNPERQARETAPGTALAWNSVTTGNLAGLDLWLDEAERGTLEIATNVVSGTVDLATLADNVVVFAGGGLGRQLSVYRLPEADWSRHVSLQHTVTFAGGADLPVYLRVTQADGHQAWTSPIYLIA